MPFFVVMQLLLLAGVVVGQPKTGTDLDEVDGANVTTTGPASAPGNSSISWFQPVTAADHVSEKELRRAYAQNETLRKKCQDFHEGACRQFLAVNMTLCKDTPHGFTSFGEVQYICPCSCLFCEDIAQEISTPVCRVPVDQTAPPKQPVPDQTTLAPYWYLVEDSSSDAAGNGFCESGSSCAVALVILCLLIAVAGGVCMLAPRLVRRCVRGSTETWTTSAVCV